MLNRNLNTYTRLESDIFQFDSWSNATHAPLVNIYSKYIYIYIFRDLSKRDPKNAAVDHRSASTLPRRSGQFGTDSVFFFSKVGDIKT